MVFKSNVAAMGSHKPQRLKPKSTLESNGDHRSSAGYAESLKVQLTPAKLARVIIQTISS